MRRALAGAAFVVGLALVLPAAAHAEPAKPFTSAELGFSATFPLEVKQASGPDGTTVAGVDPKGIMYMVGVLPIDTGEAAKKTKKQLLDDSVAGAVANVHGKLVSQKDVKLGANLGREIEVDVAPAHATFRVFAVGPRLYVIGVVVKEGVTPPMTPAAFFASFKLSGKPDKK